MLMPRTVRTSTLVTQQLGNLHRPCPLARHLFHQTRVKSDNSSVSQMHMHYLLRVNTVYNNKVGVPLSITTVFTVYQLTNVVVVVVAKLYYLSTSLHMVRTRCASAPLDRSIARTCKRGEKCSTR